jgi:glycerol-3-phosphate dehydrogenase (NAD(P)+)
MKIAVLGAGSWGTAIARMLAQKHVHVILWARNPQLVEQLQSSHENQDYLPGVLLPSSLSFTSNLMEAVSLAEYIIIATPSHALRQTVSQIKSIVGANTVIVSAVKGLETNTLKRMSEIIAEEIPDRVNRLAVLSGPNHAEEVGLQYPTTTVVAAHVREVAEAVQDLFISPYFRVYTNPDIIGVELGGALKNIIALGAGIAEGLGLGDNSKAALMTRGLAEIARLGLAMKASPLTFAGLAGIGDLIVTCTSRHSRNRRAGILIAQGKSMQEIQVENKMVVEGIRSTSAAYHLAKQHAVEMPITQEIYFVLYQGKSPKDAVYDLMMRSRTHEVEEVVSSNYWNNW